MRRRMFSDTSFDAAVFIGGMGGIIDEFRLFRHLRPTAAVVPVLSTGGATLALAAEIGGLPEDLSGDMDYVGLLHRHLGISVRERRYRRPEQQPTDVNARLWKRPPKPSPPQS